MIAFKNSVHQGISKFTSILGICRLNLEPDLLQCEKDLKSLRESLRQGFHICNTKYTIIIKPKCIGTKHSNYLPHQASAMLFPLIVQ